MTRVASKKTGDLPRWLAWGAPGISLLLLLLAPLMPSRWYETRWLSEIGFVEVATVIFLVAALWALVRILGRWRELPRRLGPFAILLLLAVIYFAGEELDWGQVWVQFETPDSLARVNREGQFSLHKIDGHRLPRLLFNVGPRTAATLAMLLGAVSPWLIAWLERRGVPNRERPLWHWLLPTARVAPTCLFAALISLPAKAVRLAYATDADAPQYLVLALRKPSGEFKEYLIALALCLYAWSLLKRLQASSPERPEPAALE